MKLKYKKVILLTIMSNMGIGLITISLSNVKSDVQENGSNSVVQPVIYVESSVDKYDDSQDSLDNIVTKEMMISLPTDTPTPSPTPTPLPVYNIEEDGYPIITELIINYYAAKNKCDVDSLQILASDPSEVYTQEKLKQLTEYIDDYRNIKTYVKKSYIDGTYIVYVYYEIKFINMKTLVPSLSKFYVITDSNGDVKIPFGTKMDEDAKAYYDARNADEDVDYLITMTNEKYDEAKASDIDLKKFCDKVEKLAKSAKMTANVDGSGTADTIDKSDGAEDAGSTGGANSDSQDKASDAKF